MSYMKKFRGAMGNMFPPTKEEFICNIKNPDVPDCRVERQFIRLLSQAGAKPCVPELLNLLEQYRPSLVAGIEGRIYAARRRR